jgi:photosystem II stability/assembly factor-like uncharacterized protein
MKRLRWRTGVIGAAAVVAAASVGIAGARTAGTYSGESELLTSASPHLPLFDIAADGDRLFAVGAGGRVLRSADGGATRTAESADTMTSLLGVSAAGDHVVAVGQMGELRVRSQDGGWTAVDTGTVERLFDIAINRNGVGVAVGAFGAVLRTEDGGASWTPAAPAWIGVFRDDAGRLGEMFAPSVYGVQIDDANRVWAAGELGLIMTSDDGGANWTIRRAGGNDETGIDPTLSSIHVRADGTGYAVGQLGTVLRTRDHGQTWKELPRATQANLLGVTSNPDGTVVVTGMRAMLISRDEGRRFDPVYGNDIATGWYHGVVAARGERRVALAVGIGGNILGIQQ